MSGGGTGRSGAGAPRPRPVARAAAALLLAALGVGGGAVRAQPAAEPTTFEAAQVARGAKLYAQHCAVCHGPKMVEDSGGFFDLRTFPHGQRSRFVNSVSNGKNGMPPWKSLLSADDIGDLWAYVVTGDKP